MLFRRVVTWGGLLIAMLSLAAAAVASQCDLSQRQCLLAGSRWYCEGGGGGPAPTPIPTVDPLAPWDTYPFQGFTSQQIRASYVTVDGQFFSAWFHGYVAANGTVINEDDYNWYVNGVTTEFVATHGLAAPFTYAASVYEFVNSGWTNDLTINGSLDGCEDPYPTPALCLRGKLPQDPYGTNDDDAWMRNDATLGQPQAVILGNGELQLSASALPSDGLLSQSNTGYVWKHRIVFP